MCFFSAEFRVTALRAVGAQPKACGTDTQQSAGSVEETWEGQEVLSEKSECKCPSLWDGIISFLFL